MGEATSINPRIIEGLYCEALVLADEVRGAFDLSGRLDAIAEQDGLSAAALSCEALRTTTRMMHAIAWLLNHRAYFMGELSEFQLRRHGRLSPDQPTADAGRVRLLSAEQREIIAATERFHARLLRLDQRWRDADALQPSAIARLRQRLEGGWAASRH